MFTGACQLYDLHVIIVVHFIPPTQWDVYFDQIEQIATSVPFMVAIGNHERNWPNSR